MQEDVKKFLSMFEGEKIADIFKKFDLDIDDFADDFSAFLQRREKIHNEYFSFVDKYINDEDYKNIFRDYATGFDKYRVDEILNMILKRRDDAIFSMEEFIEELREMKKSEGVTLWWMKKKNYFL